LNLKARSFPQLSVDYTFNYRTYIYIRIYLHFQPNAMMMMIYYIFKPSA